MGRENVKISPEQMKDIINLLIIEEKLEEAEKKKKDKEKEKESETKDKKNGKEIREKNTTTK